MLLGLWRIHDSLGGSIRAMDYFMAGGLFLLGFGDVMGRLGVSALWRWSVLGAGAVLVIPPWLLMISYTYDLFGGVILLLIIGGIPTWLLSHRLTIGTLPLLTFPVWIIFILEDSALLLFSLLALLAVPTMLFFKTKHRISFPILFLSFTIYWIPIYGILWHRLPSPSSVTFGRDSAVRQIVELRDHVDEKWETKPYALEEDCSGQKLHLLNSIGRPGVWTLDRSSGEVTPRNDLQGSGDQLIFDCQRNRAYFAEYDNDRILFFNKGSLNAQFQEVQVTIEDPNKIAHHPESELVYFLPEQYGEIYVISVDGILLFQSKTPCLTEEIIPLADDTFIAGSGKRLCHIRTSVSESRFETLGTISLPGKKPSFEFIDLVNMAYDGLGDTIYVSEFSSGRIYSLSLREMEATPLAQLDLGVRYMVHAPQYGTLAIGNFLTGDIVLIHQDSGEIQYRKNLGSRLRRLSLSRDRQRIYAVSRGGFFELSLQKVFMNEGEL